MCSFLIYNISKLINYNNDVTESILSEWGQIAASIEQIQIVSSRNSSYFSMEVSDIIF